MDPQENDLLERIISVSGQNLHLCFQCAKCSSGCPSLLAMDYAPSQLLRLLLLAPEEAAETNAIWRCASCYTCVSRCPKGIDISKIAEAVRSIHLRNRTDHVELSSIDTAILQGPQQLLVAAARKYTG